MLDRSSTSSSECLAGAWKTWGAVLSALVLLLVGYNLICPVLRQVVASRVSEDLLLFFAARTSPTVLVAGSSRNGLAIHEATLEAVLGMECSKIPINASTPWETLRLLEIFPGKFRNVKILILDLAPYQFNANCPTVFQEGRTIATLGVQSMLLPRITLEEALGKASYQQSAQQMERRWALHNAASINEIEDSAMEPQSAADRFMDEFVLSGFVVRAARRLALLCREREILLVLNLPPAMAEHVHYLREAYPAQYQTFLEVIETLRTYSSVRVIAAETFSCLGVSEVGMFIDYGHMTENGARSYTEWLATRIQEVSGHST